MSSTIRKRLCLFGKTQARVKTDRGAAFSVVLLNTAKFLYAGNRESERETPVRKEQSFRERAFLSVIPHHRDPRTYRHGQLAQNLTSHLLSHPNHHQLNDVMYKANKAEFRGILDPLGLPASLYMNRVGG